MFFVLSVAIIYLYLKYKDVSKDLDNLNNHLDNIEKFIDNIEDKELGEQTNEN